MVSIRPPLKSRTGFLQLCSFAREPLGAGDRPASVCLISKIPSGRNFGYPSCPTFPQIPPHAVPGYNAACCRIITLFAKNDRRFDSSHRVSSRRSDLHSGTGTARSFAGGPLLAASWVVGAAGSSHRLDVARAERRILLSRGKYFLRHVEKWTSELAVEHTKPARHVFRLPAHGTNMEFCGDASFRYSDSRRRHLLMKNGGRTSGQSATAGKRPPSNHSPRLGAAHR
jgi:hypothetical protein